MRTGSATSATVSVRIDLSLRGSEHFLTLTVGQVAELVEANVYSAASTSSATGATVSVRIDLSLRGSEHFLTLTVEQVAELVEADVYSAASTSSATYFGWLSH